MRHKGKLLLSVAASVFCLVAPLTVSAQADTISSLPITSFYQIVADTAHGHIFLSQGSSSRNDIIVTNLIGQEVATISGQDGVMGMTLSVNGSTLYAALASDHAVSAISTATLGETARYPLGDLNTPQDLALQSGKLWVSYNTGTVGEAAIGDFDLSAASPALKPQAVMGGWYAAPQLAADSQDTGVLVAAEPGLSPAEVASYDVSVDPGTIRARSLGLQNCDNEGDLAVVPGGSQFILACGAPYAHYRYSTADLSQQGSYASAAYPDAIAIAADGTVAAGINGSASPDVYVYQPGGDTPLNTYQVADSDQVLMPRGLAWSAEGTQLYSVVRSSVPDSTAFSYALRVTYPPLDPSTISLSGPGAASIGESVSIEGHLAPTGTTLPAGTKVTVMREAADNISSGTTLGGTPVGTFPVASDGSFSAVTNAPETPGTYIYVAIYNGSTGIPPAIATHTLTVTPGVATLSMTAPSTGHVGDNLTLTGTLSVGTGSLPAGAEVGITRTVAGAGAETKSVSVTTTSSGTFSWTDTPPVAGSYTYTASYAGNSAIGAAETVRQVTVAGAPSKLTVTTGATTFNYKPTVHVSAHLGTSHTNRTVAIYAQSLGSTTKRLIKSGPVNRYGDLTVAYQAAHSTTFSATYSGDAWYAPVTVMHTVYVHAKTSLAISGYYASERVGGVTYRLYHHTAHLNAAVVVAPNKAGECVKLEVQEYYRGGWHANVATGCGTLDSASELAGYLELNTADRNYPYRVRADYIRSVSDSGNLGADSGWRYFMAEK